MSRFFHEELNTLKDHLREMATQSIKVVELTLAALENDDVDKAAAVIDLDDAIDHLEVQIDQEAIRYLSLRAPVASDLRLITMAMKISNDLERVGDEATSIAKRVIKLERAETLSLLNDIPKMGQVVVKMLRDAIDSLMTDNLSLALDVAPRDREVDDMHKNNHRVITESIARNPEAAFAGVELIFISKSLERIGDHATNICEDVVFLLRAEDIRHSDAVKKK